MENKDLTLDVLLFFIPVVGLFFLWKLRKTMKPVYFYMCAAYGFVCLATLVLEVYKVAYL